MLPYSLPNHLTSILQSLLNGSGMGMNISGPLGQLLTSLIHQHRMRQMYPTTSSYQGVIPRPQPIPASPVISMFQPYYTQPQQQYGGVIGQPLQNHLIGRNDSTPSQPQTQADVPADLTQGSSPSVYDPATAHVILGMLLNGQNPIQNLNLLNPAG